MLVLGAREQNIKMKDSFLDIKHFVRRIYVATKSYVAKNSSKTPPLLKVHPIYVEFALLIVCRRVNSFEVSQKV